MTQFTSLYKKNFTYWRRGTCGCICEFMTPIVFALLLMWFKSLSEDVKKMPSSYLATSTSLSPPALLDSETFPKGHKTYIDALKESKAKGIIKQLFKTCDNKELNPDDREIRRGGKVALGPKGNKIAEKLATFVKEVYDYNVWWFDSAKAVEEAAVSDYYGGLDEETGRMKQICVGVIFQESGSNGKWEYSIHYNNTGNENRDDIRDLEDSQIIPFQKENEDFWPKSIKSGFPYLINLIDEMILQEETNNINARIRAKLTKMPVQEYKTSDIFKNTQGSISIYVLFPLAVIYLRFVYSVLYEKEHKISQNLRNMGMSMTAHYLSWILFYDTVILAISIVWTIMIKISLFPDANIILVFFLFFLTGTFMISIGFFVTSLFQKAKPGVLCALIIFFFLYGASIGLNSVSDPNESTLNIFALSPFAGLEKTGYIMLLVQANYEPFGFQLFSTLITKFRYSTFFYLTVFQIFFWPLIGMWIDQVFPGETGIRKHPLFCLGVKRKKDKDTKERIDLKYKSGNFEEVDPSLIAYEQTNKTLKIENLRKVYPNGHLAVKNLNLTMYSDQIFALLGHNGAGKTTTISMISGLLPLTHGKINIMGYDSVTETEEVKRIMGVCPQTNPIYPNLTCGEHLELYSKVKNKGKKLNKKEMEEEINTVLKDIDLLDKKNYQAGKLSGGQKRKLCVACAFIGGSKVILLDEPTSGMDTYARRQLWEMLKIYKKDKIIILTTHYMDEADYLGDRIGIMGEGELLTCGSSLFLKKRFGIGYNLTVVKLNPKSSTDKLTKAVQDNIPEAKLEGDISKEIKYVLPSKDSDKFENLFKILEDDAKELGIQSFGISLTTLEEVFLRVAAELGLNKKDEEADLIRDDDEEVELDKIRIKDNFTIFKLHFGALLKKRMIYFKRDKKGLVCEIIVPIMVVTIGLLITMISFIGESKEGMLTPQIFESNTKFWINNNPDYSTFNSNLKNEENLDLTKIDSSVNTLTKFDDYLKDNRDRERIYSAFINKIENNDYDYNLFFNSTAPNSIHVGLNFINTAILKTATNNPNAKITIKLDPLPLTQTFKRFENTADGFMSVFLISLAFAFIPSSMIMFVVYEREKNVKHQQIVSGVSLTAYWFSNFLVDYVKYLIPAFYTILAILIFNVEAFRKDDHYSAVIVIFLLFGFALIPFTYLTSFMFKSPSAAQVFTFVYSFFAGFVLMLTSFVLRLIQSTREAQKQWIEYLFRIHPMFDFAFGMFSIANADLWWVIYKLKEVPKAWSFEGCLKELISMILLSVLSFTLIFYIETKKSKSKEEGKKSEKKENQILNLPVHQERVAMPKDVLDEQKLVDSSNNFSIKVQNLKKVYKMYGGGKVKSEKWAVKGISFGVEKGECFGLLGTNGAGKTTTFKILSGEIQPTAGIAMINGKNVSTDMKKIRNLIGYCPQFDALLDNLTAREHLDFYAAIKGIPKNMRKKLIDAKIRELNLKKYEHKLAGTYSGGNKRKLSVAIALLGNPPIVFLDEPSSGMDPEARRFMWSVVGKVSNKTKKSSVVLTTHSMEEAEALSTKLAIMVEGRIKCIGPVQLLKDRYGKGYEIEVKLKKSTDEEMKILKEKCGCKEVEWGMNEEEVRKALEKLGDESLKKKIFEGKIGSYIKSQVQNGGTVRTGVFLNFAHAEKKNEAILKFMRGAFGRISIIEAYRSFYLYKVHESVPLSKLFGEMERNSEELEVLEYSIKQASIEQIFVNFANERVAD